MAWRKTRRKSNRQCANYLDDDELADLPDSPDAALFASLLRRCKKLPQARRLHSYIALSGLETISRVVANMIIHMYGACGSVDDSWTMFQRMRSPRNVYSWNILITANANNGHLADAGAVLSRMPQHDKASWTLHIAMLARSGKLALAQRVFDDIIDPDVTAWNAIIAVYAETGHSKEALALFRKLDIEGVASDSITFISVLDSCNDLRLGKIIHAEAANSGFLNSNINLGTAVVTMYARCQSLRDAEQSFSQMPHRNVVSWSAMTAAYARSNSVDRAEQAFQRTPSHCSISANTMIWSYVQSSRLRDAKNIFDSMVDRDVVSWSSMLCGYTSGIDYDLHNAREFFQSMPTSYASVSAWNTLLAAYARSGHYTETIHLFKIMDLEGFQPDELTFSSAFEACRGVSGAKTGRILHAIFAERGLPLDEYAGTSLVAMYGSAGNLEEAEAVFSVMCNRNAVAWNAMIAAYDNNGDGEIALEKFQEMELEGEPPDEVTFVTVLAACSHVGRVEIGRLFFSKLADYGIDPVVDHYLCVLDLLGRAGRLHEAEELLVSMPFVPDDVAWTTLLSASSSAADKAAAELEGGGDSSLYVLLSNAYTASKF